MERHEKDLVLKLLTCFDGVSLVDLQGGSRKRPLVDARHYISYFLRIEKKWTFKKIADALGKDHASIMAGVTKVAGYLDVYEKSREILDSMAEACKQSPNSYAYDYTKGWEVSATC